jgi:hypothetical protein
LGLPFKADPIRLRPLGHLSTSNSRCDFAPSLAASRSHASPRGKLRRVAGEAHALNRACSRTPCADGLHRGR